MCVKVSEYYKEFIFTVIWEIIFVVSKAVKFFVVKIC